MREISEYTLLGNYLIFLNDRLGVDSIKYELVKSFSDKILQKVNKNGDTYNLLQLDAKMDIVKKMIGKGVFRTTPGNPLKPFKQVYDFEASKYICAYYSCDGNLCFKFTKTTEGNRDLLLASIKNMYSSSINLELKNSLSEVLKEYEIKNKSKTKLKFKE